MTSATSLFIETARDESTLLSHLAERLTEEAILASRRFSMHLLEAAPRGPEQLRRRARLLLLLMVDALNAHRPEQARIERWRRFINELAPFAEETKSPALRWLVAENADLVTEGPRSVAVKTEKIAI